MLLMSNRRGSYAERVDPVNVESLVTSARPYLHAEALGSLGIALATYADTMPAGTPTGDSAHELESSPYHEYEARWFETQTSLHDVGIEEIAKLKPRLGRKIREEFIACGIDTDDPHFIAAMSRLTDSDNGLVLSATIELEERDERYRSLAGLFFETPLATDELALRMSSELQSVHGAIARTERMPDSPGLFSLPETRRQYKRVRSYKERVVEKATGGLRSRESILEDYFSSADAAFRRMVYGYRPMVLDRGLDSDDATTIDSFQRKHYDEFWGGNYTIHLTPKEWTRKYLDEQVDSLLYDPESEIAAYLDAQVVADSYYAKNRTWRTQTYQHAKPDHESYRDKPSQARHKTRQPSDDTELYAALSEDWQQSAIRDIALLFDAHSEGTTASDRHNILRRTSTLIAEMKPVESSTDSRKVLIKKLIAAYHPDRADGDIDLCKIVTRLFEEVKNDN